MIGPGQGHQSGGSDEWYGIKLIAAGHAKAGTRERVRHAMPLHRGGKWRGKVLLARDGMLRRSILVTDGWPQSRGIHD